MALAAYYNRAALAAAQVITGFDPQQFQATLEATPVGVSFDHATTQSREGQALLDLTVRLLARLYPTITIRPGPGADPTATRLTDLAQAINPSITINDTPTLGVAVGHDAPTFDRTVHAGSDAWTARLSSGTPQRTGDCAIPFGAGAAACLAASAIFRAVLIDTTEPLTVESTFSCLDGVERIAAPAGAEGGWELPNPTVLVGCGAVGQAAIWALARAPVRGELFLVDGERIELSNLQRYVLTTLADDDAVKTTLAADAFSNAASNSVGNAVNARGHRGDWASFTETYGHRWAAVLTALDSAFHRRAVQATLPRWIANAWTQPGDLGVSTHPFDTGACLNCLYLPAGEGPNEDRVVADALGIPTRLTDVRTLLHSGGPTPSTLLDAVAAGLAVPREHLEPFAGQPIRKLYVEGICGGAVLPLGTAGTPRHDVHVPLAHQSALAGVLLAARLTRKAADADPGTTEITRLNILRDPGEQPTQPALKDPRGICICQDTDYQTAYTRKWPNESPARHHT